MNKSDYSRLRVLLVGGKSHVAQTLRGVMLMAGVTQVTQVAEQDRAIELLSQDDFDAVFYEDDAASSGTSSFPLTVRLAPGVLNPLLPIFVFRDKAGRSRVEKARDTGATDFITCPVSARTIMDKLAVAISHPRPFIKAPEFFGPDRRAMKRAGFFGEDRRKRTPRKIKIGKGGRAAPAECDSDSVLI